MRCGGCTGPIFTTASKGPAAPLYPEIFLSKTSSYSLTNRLNSECMLFVRIESGSSWTDKECSWGVGEEGATRLLLLDLGTSGCGYGM